MTVIEQQRLQDFKNILTYHLVNKITYFFNCDYNAFFDAPKNYTRFVNAGENRKFFNSDEVHDIYRNLIECFNRIALPKGVVQNVFGRQQINNKWVKIQYKNLINRCGWVKRINSGVIITKGKRTHFASIYLLERDYIARIFEDPDSYQKARDPNSDFYTIRQRSIIFKHLLTKQKTEKKDDMTKKEKEQYQKEYAEGKHQISLKEKQKLDKKRKAVALKRDVTIAKKKDADYMKLQESHDKLAIALKHANAEIDRLSAEIRRLQNCKDKNSDIPVDDNQPIQSCEISEEQRLAIEQMRREFQADIDACMQANNF